MDLAFDASGNLVVLDRSNHAVRVLAANGQLRTLAGSGSAGFADGQGSAARFHFPSGLAVDASGIVYVADTDNSACAASMRTARSAAWPGASSAVRMAWVRRRASATPRTGGGRRWSPVARRPRQPQPALGSPPPPGPRRHRVPARLGRAQLPVAAGAAGAVPNAGALPLPGLRGRRVRGRVQQRPAGPPAAGRGADRIGWAVRVSAVGGLRWALRSASSVSLPPQAGACRLTSLKSASHALANLRRITPPRATQRVHLHAPAPGATRAMR